MINSRKAIWAHNLHSFHTEATSGGALPFMYGVRFTWVQTFLAGPQLSSSLTSGNNNNNNKKRLWNIKMISPSSVPVGKLHVWWKSCFVLSLEKQIQYVKIYLEPHNLLNDDYSCTDRTEGIRSTSSCTRLQRHPSHTDRARRLIATAIPLLLAQENTRLLVIPTLGKSESVAQMSQNEGLIDPAHWTFKEWEKIKQIQECVHLKSVLRWLITVWASASANIYLQWAIVAFVQLEMDFYEQSRFWKGEVLIGRTATHRGHLGHSICDTKCLLPDNRDNYLFLMIPLFLPIEIYSQQPDWQLWENQRPWVQLHGKAVEYMSPITGPSLQK